MRHQVFFAMNRPRAWWGVGHRIFLIAAGAGLSVLAFTTGKVGMPVALGIFLLIAAAGAVAAKYDPRFLSLFPILIRLHSGYEAGPDEHTGTRLTEQEWKKKRRSHMKTLIIVTIAAAPLWAASHKNTKPAEPTVKSESIAPPAEPVDPPRAKTFRLGDRDIITINTHVRYDTWILLPPGEAITDAGAGDPENWGIKVADDKRPTNLIHVKPALVNSKTNLNLRTASGRIYSFLLVETSKSCPNCAPDFKVFIDQPENTISLVKPNELAEKDKTIRELTATVDRLRAETAAAKTSAEAQMRKDIATFRSEYPVSLRCNYNFRQGGPFFLEAVCNDTTFTYLKIGSDDVPSVYNEIDGKPGLTKVDYIRNPGGHGGTLVIGAVVRKGQLQAGRKKLNFAEAPVPPRN